MSWNIWDFRNLFLKLKTKLGLHHIVLTTLTTSAEKLTLILVEMQQIPDIGKIESKKEVAYLKSAIHNGRWNVCVNFKTDTDNLENVVYRYRNSVSLKDNEVHLRLTEYQ